LKESTMNHLLTRRAFSAGLAAGIPAILLGRTVASQSPSSVPDAALAGVDLESVFLRVSPYRVRDILLATPFQTEEGVKYQVERWADISTSPYFSSVGGVNVYSASGGMGSESVLGAYGIYLAKAGALAGQYLGRRALEDATSDVLAQEIDGFAAETLVYENGEGHNLTQVAVGNVMVLGYDLDASGQATGDELASVTNATLLVSHLRQTFQAVM
jgi:hypothetical protein